MIKDLYHHPFYIWSVHHTEALRVAVMLHTIQTGRNLENKFCQSRIFQKLHLFL